MINNVEITLQTILALFGGVTCVAGGVSAIVKLLSPFKKLKEKVDRHDEKLKEECNEIKEIDKAIKNVEDSNRVICRSLLVLLNHEATGNGIDKIIEQRDLLQQHLIDK